MMHWACDYIGKPWVSGGTGPDGFDCYGLVRAVFRDRLSISLPVVDVNACNALSIARAFKSESNKAGWRPVSMAKIQEFDVVELSVADKPHHVGLWLDVDGGGALCCVGGMGVVFQNLASLRLTGWNVVDVRRWTDLEGMQR